MHRPLAPDVALGVIQISVLAFRFRACDRKSELPLALLPHRPHELVGDQQRQIELPQAALLALGAYEIHHIGMTDIEGAHLRAAAPTGG